MIRILWLSTIIYIVHIFSTCQTSNIITMVEINFRGDPEYVSDESKVYLVNKDIKNEIYSSVHLVKTLPNSSTAHIQAFVETNGEYKILENVDQWMPMCDLIDEPIILGKVFRNMGFKGCPVEPGVYSNPSYIAAGIEGSSYPPGNYMVKLQVETEDKTMMISSLESKFKIE